MDPNEKGDSVMRLNGKVGIVTGGASGIGRAIALALANAGADIVITDLNEAAGQATVKELEAAGNTAFFQKADVSKREEAKRLIEAAIGRFGRLDILVNNAGLQHVAPIQDFPEEKWDLLLGVMLTGAFLLTKYALPNMIRQRFGRIINIASAHGLVASPFKAAYVSAKHGLLGLTKVIALEGAPHNITAVAVCPGYVRTPLVEQQIADQAKAHGVSEQQVLERVLLARQAVKRLLEPEEVADLVVFLCGDHASGITGTSIAMDLGWTAH
ncbi:MAG: 3-hydroxybutyrate dehydrogenase [Acidobacteria bacterium]|nr:3-hydroxybutyrate dehydrogenase [Acidobacteriota bacterium]